MQVQIKCFFPSSLEEIKLFPLTHLQQSVHNVKSHINQCCVKRITVDRKLLWKLLLPRIIYLGSFDAYTRRISNPVILMFDQQTNFLLLTSFPVSLKKKKKSTASQSLGEESCSL